MFRAFGAAFLRGASNAARYATSAAEKPAGRTGNLEAIMRKYKVSPELSEFLGQKEATRSEALSKVWGYIRTHQLQNPDKKTEYLPDAKLKKVLPADTVSFAEISKLVSKHFPEGAPKKPKAPKEPKAPKAKKAQSSKKVPPSEKRMPIV